MANLAVLEGLGTSTSAAPRRLNPVHRSRAKTITPMLGAWAIFRPSKYVAAAKATGRIASKVGESTIGKVTTAIAKPLIVASGGGAAWDLLTPAKRKAGAAVQSAVASAQETATEAIEAGKKNKTVLLIGGLAVAAVVLVVFIGKRRR
jgi:hypothetical protein